MFTNPIHRLLRLTGPLFLAGPLLMLCSCGSSGKSDADTLDTVIIEESYDCGNTGTDGNQSEAYAPTETEPDVSHSTHRYTEKLAEIAANPNNSVVFTDNGRIWYSICNREEGYKNRLYVYDTENGTEKTVNLNKISMEDDEMRVEDMYAYDGIVTIIMSEDRNSNGWLDGTYVWQYNCRTGAWKPLARACSGAKFVDGRRSVQINNVGAQYRDLCEYDKALKYIGMAYAISKETGRIEDEAVYINRLGRVYAQMGDTESAKEKFEIAISLLPADHPEAIDSKERLQKLEETS